MIAYMLHAALLLSIFYAFYKLLLQRETFYNLNRAVLLACILFCFILPLLEIPASWSLQGEPPVFKVFRTGNIEPSSAASPDLQAGQGNVSESAVAAAGTIDRVMQWIGYLYWFGVTALGLSFILQVLVLVYTAYSKPSIIDGKFRIVELSNDKAPCSFFNIIFINPIKYDWETYEQVLKHEKIHAAQGHSVDILLAEMALVFQWFNPFAWLYRNELENNLEYLTDQAVLQKDRANKAVYQESLLKVAVPQLALRLTAKYNQSLLKKRLLRMEFKQSNLHTLWKYSFLLPLCFVLICAFNKPAILVNTAAKERPVQSPLDGMTNVGLWYAVMENKNVNFYLRPVSSGSKSSAQLQIPSADLKNFMKGRQQTFSLSREAGTIVFTGEFEEGKGIGRYQFLPDKTYIDYMTLKGVSDFNASTQLSFFFLDITRKYVDMVSSQVFSAKDMIHRRSAETSGKPASKDKRTEEPSILDKPVAKSGDRRINDGSGVPAPTNKEIGQQRPLPVSPGEESRLNPGIKPEVINEIREEALKRALAASPFHDSLRSEARKQARYQWQADSLKRKGKDSKNLKVEMPIVIKVERKPE